MHKTALILLTATLAGCCGTCHTRTGGEAAAKAHHAYVEAINSNNVDRMLAMLTDDVVFLPPNEKPMVGKAALKPWLDGYVAAFTTHWEKQVDEFVVAGEWAFERYSWQSTDVPKGGGDTLKDTGWGFLTYHHDADGTWRVARDAWGVDHPAK